VSTDPIIAAIGRCNPEEPLKPGDPRWQDFDAVRGTQLHVRVARRLRAQEAAGRYCHLALAGHRGCGKSTELARIVANAKSEGYLALYVVVNEEADPNELGFGDLFLLMLRRLEHAFRSDAKLKPLPERTVSIVTDWFRDVTRVQEKEIERVIEVSAEAKAGFDSPLAKLLFGLSALRRTTGKDREEIKEAVEKYPVQLRSNLNLLLDDAAEIAADAYPKGPLFVLDNLDRYPPEMISEVMLTNADQFNAVAAHIIFVVPISLIYTPPGQAVEDCFETETLPMLPVFRQQERTTADEEVIDVLTEAIFKRVDASLFADTEVARQLAGLSGGCPRDLMRLLKEALIESTTQVDEQAIKRSVGRVRGEMARKLTLGHYGVLARVHLDGHVDPDETGRLLLFRRAALEYNGEHWEGVHPLLWEAPEFKAALEREQSARVTQAIR
jgi:hypothetical protein